MANNVARLSVLDPASLGLPPRVAGSQVLGVLERLQSNAINLLGAVTEVTATPPGHVVVVRVCRVNTADGGGHIYKQSGLYALHKPALRQLAELAAVSDVPEHCRRTDDRSDPDYASFVATGRRLGLDGTEIIRTGHADQDLRIGSEVRDALEERIALGRVEGATREVRNDAHKAAKDLRTKRQFVARLAQEKAENAMIRSILSLRQTYTLAELDRPFVALVPQWVGTGSPVEAAITALIRNNAHASLYPAAIEAASRFDAAPPAIETRAGAGDVIDAAPDHAYTPGPRVREAFAAEGLAGDDFDALARSWHSDDDARAAFADMTGRGVR